MNANWKTYKIVELAEKVGIGPFGSSIKVETFVESGIPVISGIHLKGIRLEDCYFNFVSQEHADRLINANVYRGDVIFTHAGNIGAVAYIPQDSKYERYILSQRQFYLRCNRQKLIPEFITYFFKSAVGQKKLLANTSSSGVPSIAQPVTYLRSIEVEVPDVATQNKISSILSSLDDKIELNRKMNQSLESIAQAIFKQWFVDFQFPGSTGGLENELPNGWSKKSILEIAELLSGGTPKTEISEYWNGEIDWVSAKDISASNGTFILESEKKISSIGLENSNTKILPAFTTVITARGSVGNYAILSKEMTINQTNYGLKIKSCNGDFFLFLLISNLIDQLKQSSYGTIFDTITTRTFRDMYVISPPNKIIEAFDIQIKPFMVKILHNLSQINLLTTIRDSLLPKLITGKIPVN